MGGVVKTVKKAVKGVTKVVKSVAKSIAKVGKAVMKGVSKTLGKLGPLASIAMMAIPGFQPFAAGLWAEMGIGSVIGQRMMTSAFVGFVGSGGDIKAALTGAALAGAGTVLGGIKEGFQAGSTFGESISKTLSAQSNITDFSTGLRGAEIKWNNFTGKVGTFTDKVGKFFGAAGNGDASVGFQNALDTVNSPNVVDQASFSEEFAAKIEATPVAENVNSQRISEYGNWGATEESVMKADFARGVQEAQKLGIDVGTSAEDFYASRVESMGNRLMQAGVSPDIVSENLSMVDTLEQKVGTMEDLMKSSGLPSEYVKGPDGMFMKNPIYQVADDYNIDFRGEQAQKLLAQEYEGFQYNPDTNSVSFDKDLSFYNPEDRQLFRESGAGGTPTYMTEDMYKNDLKPFKPSLLSPSTGTGFTPYAGAGEGYEQITSEYGMGAGTGSGTGTDPLRESQPLLVARIEAEKERQAKLARSGWNIGRSMA